MKAEKKEAVTVWTVTVSYYRYRRCAGKPLREQAKHLGGWIENANYRGEPCTIEFAFRRRKDSREFGRCARAILGA